MSKRKEFLDSVHPDRVQDFLHFIKLHKDASEPLDVSEVVQELQVKQRLELWSKMAALLRHTLHSYPSERWISRLDHDPDADDMEVEQSAELKHTMSVLDGVTVVCTVCVDVIQSGDAYDNLLDCALTLNSVESYLPVSEMPLQKAIHWLCECWWRRSLRGKEELGWTAFVACLENTITLKKTKDAPEPLDVSEVVQELQVKQRLELWSKMAALLRHTLHSYPSERWISRLDHDPDADDMEVEQSAELKHTMSVLDGVTVVCTVCVDVIQSGDAYDNLLDCALTLNSVESYLPVSEMPLQKAIHWLCECWWRRSLRGKEELGWTAFVACLENTITLKKTVESAATLEDSSVCIQDYAEYVTGYISTCVDNIVPTIQVRKFPNQKPWINSQVRHMLRARSVAFATGNETEYKAAKYRLRRAITAAKRQYKEKLDSFYSTADARRMWQGLQHITDYKTTTNTTISLSDSLPDDLNTFYARFETSSLVDTERTHTHTRTTQSPSPPPTVSSAVVHKALRKINPRKAAGPDNIPGRALRACATELADVLTSIFNLSLSQNTVPTCFKTTTIIPLPKKSPPTCLNDYRPCSKWFIPACLRRADFCRVVFSVSVSSAHFSRPRVMTSLPVLQILAHFHKQKFRQGVDEMLHRLYMPVLWKALKAVNAEVRANATLLFTEAFPVHDPSMSSDRVDELVQKQLDTLFALLEDVSPSVRCAAVLGACSVVSRCWELLPSSILTDLLKKLLDLASDSSSPDCRCAVFMCMSMILDNRMSHPLMEKLLPALKLSLHDTSEKVRVAFVDLLLKIKAVRAAKFWKVCSMEHLLMRLELDSVCVSKRIVNLLFSSFLPVAQPEAVWCERCVSMIQMNPGAARKFYRYAYMYTAPTNIVKLMLMIRKCLNACIQKTGENPDESVCSNKENNSVLEDVLSVKDASVMASLLELVVILWRSVQKSLQLNQEALQYTTAKFASVLPEYLRVFQLSIKDAYDNVETLAVLECRVSSHLHFPDSVISSASSALSSAPFFLIRKLLRSKVSAQLKRLNSGSPVSLYGQLIECVCGWGQVSHVLDLAVQWLTEATPLNTVDVSGSDSRRVQFEEPVVEVKPELGLDYVEYMLSRPHTRDSVLSLRVDQLSPLLTALAAWKAVLYSSLSEGEVSEAVTETALRAFGVHTRLTVHLQHKHPEGRSFLTTLEESMDWVEKRVLPFLVAPGDNVSEQQLSLSRRIVEICLYVCRDAVQVALGDSNFNDHVLQLCSYVLLSEKGYVCVPVLLSLLTEVAQDCVSHNAEEQEEQLSVTLRIIANIFQKVLEVMAHRLRKDKEEGQELCCSSRDALHNFLLVTQLVSERSEVMTGIFSSLCAAIIIDISRTLQKISNPEELTTPETVTDLPPLSSTILSTILKSPAVTRCFLAEMSSTVDSEAIDSIDGLASITHVLAIVRKTEKFSADLKAISVSVHRQILQQYGVTADESAHRIIYENAVGTLNELLMP
ncbi:hypothetical protein PGIGA_G00198560 [Pangasianodon gigas]|uniref:Uncharacterized protein n=1 Tax=Pangasianodon gigas TaxID=30993 RepID=A0ACC5WE91_PANGG|nr:hypothetical protein [Pangasianodon gigas]